VNKMSLTETFKVLTGRMLSTEKARQAETGKSGKLVFFLDNLRESLYQDGEGNLVREFAEYDPRCGSIIETDVLVYDDQRRLIRREIAKGGDKSVTLKYTPGDLCWSEKTVRRMPLL
jgi:hypothetical protein